MQSIFYIKHLYKGHTSYSFKQKISIRYIFCLLIMVLAITSCSKEVEAADRLGKSKAVEEESTEPGEERYFIREQIVKVKYGPNAPVTVFLVYLDDGLSQKGIDNCLEGMKRFNDQGLMFQLKRTTDRKKAHISAILTEPSKINNFFAKTQYARRGMPGKTIKLNSTLYGAQNPELPTNMASVFAHELGHAFGFVHIDYKDNKFSCHNLAYTEKMKVPVRAVFGTVTSKPVDNSFMLACINRKDNRPFLLLDKIGVYNVYGRYKDEGLPFIKYKGENGYSNYFTADYNELGEGNENYKPEGMVGRIYIKNTPTDSRIPLAYYFNPKTRDHFYTTVLSQLGMGKDDYEFIRLYFIYPKSKGNSRVPLVRFFSKDKQQHFHTTDITEAYKLQKDKSWKYEGVIGYLTAL